MPYVLKPKFEQHRATLLKSGLQMREKDVVPVQSALVDAVGSLPDLLIEKVRRLPKADSMIEITAKYFGLAADQTELVHLLKKTFPSTSMGLENEMFTVSPSEEAVLVQFAGQKDGRNLTGKVLVLLF